MAGPKAPTKPKVSASEVTDSKGTTANITPDADKEPSGSTLLEFGRDGAQGFGTLGDLHPWLFWQTIDRSQRGMGSWSQAWAGMTKTPIL